MHDKKHVDWNVGSNVTTLVKDEQGMAIIPISDMLEMVEGDQWDLLQWGYEASRCNEEGLVDYGSCIQFFLEDKFYRHPRHTVYSKASIDLYGTLLELLCKDKWDSNFPNSRNPERSYVEHGQVFMRREVQWQ